MSRAERRARGDYRPRVTVPDGEGDEPRIALPSAVIEHAVSCPAGPNLYTCEDCGQVTVTVHAHRGVTPMFLACRRTTGCRGMATSGMYSTRLLPAELRHDPVWEWYRPSVDELAGMTSGQRDHVERGGLAIRIRTGVWDADNGTVRVHEREETDAEKRARVAAVFGGRS